MKPFVIMALLCMLPGYISAEDKRKRIIALDAGQALLSGMLIESPLLIFRYEMPLSNTAPKNRSRLFSLYTGSLCANNCWDYIAMGAGMRTYKGAYADSSYISYDVIVGSHERDGLVAGANIGLGFTTIAGKNLIADPYIKVGTGGTTIGMNIGMMF
ncbi:MAG: hypothetical protein OEX03_02515 [Gammaproteobacteria bacterium]|nr:hypothetical protein [Gammaproteobacteria bacterium]